MKRLRLVSTLLACSSLLVGLVPMPKGSALSGSEFQAGRIIDDSKFFATNTMSATDVQNFLNAKVPVCDTNGTQPYAGTTRASYGTSRGYPPPYICLKDYHMSIPSKAPEIGLCNGITASGAFASEVIAWVAQSCGINPQVLIVLLQKEQSLITDDWPWPIQYRSATGYGCPDTAPCDAEYYGFFNQVYNAARQFKRYARDANLFSYRSGANNYIQYNPDAGCGGSTVYIQNQATANLYNYTPYQPNTAALNNLYGTGDSCSSYGNRNFWRMYNDWFGSTFGPPDYSCKSGANAAGASTGGKVVPNQYNAGTNTTFSLTLPNNTGTGCIEIHTWAANQQAWMTNVATNHPSINPADGEIIAANLYGDSKSELVFVKYRNNGSGRIEIHTWDATYQRWLSNIATNHPAIDPADGRVIAADVNGDGIDELVFVKYRNNGSGKIEIHTWAAGQQSWLSNIATNNPAVDPTDSRVIGANLYGGPADEFVLVKYRLTGTGRIEVHTWNASLQNWLSNIATNHPVVDPNDIEVIAGNVYGGAIDEMVLVKYRNSGSGRIEIHTWAAGQQSWLSNIATNYGAL